MRARPVFAPLHNNKVSNDRHWHVESSANSTKTRAAGLACMRNNTRLRTLPALCIILKTIHSRLEENTYVHDLSIFFSAEVDVTALDETLTGSSVTCRRSLVTLPNLSRTMRCVLVNNARDNMYNCRQRAKRWLSRRHCWEFFQPTRGASCESPRTVSWTPITIKSWRGNEQDCGPHAESL